MKFEKYTVITALLLGIVNAGDNYVGCYSNVDFSSSKGTYTWQTPSNCAQQCDGSAYVALKNGNECYCLDKKPSGKELDSSKCNLPCTGYGLMDCGGSDYFGVYGGNGEESQSSNLSSLSDTSSTTNPSKTSSGISLASLTSQPSSSSAPATTSSSDSSTTTSSPSTKETTSLKMTSKEVVSSSSGGKVIYKTSVVTTSSTPTSTSTSTSKHSDSNSKSSGTNVGAIVGGIIGGLAAIAIITGLILFFWKRRNNNDSDEEQEYFDKPSSLDHGSTNKSKKINQLSLLDRPMSNPFTDPTETPAAAGLRNDLVDPRMNEIMKGRRRLSDGSLADEADYSRKILQVANP